MSKKTNNYIQTPEKNQVFQLEQGLKNQRTIVQYPNKTWPFWVYKQFNPESSQFNSHSNPCNTPPSSRILESSSLGTLKRRSKADRFGTNSPQS